MIVILVGILPLYLKIASNIKENEKLTYQIKEQNELRPVYVSLLTAMKDKDLLVLPNPEKKPLPRLDAGKFRDDFRAVAKKSGVTIVSFVPDTSTSAGSSTSLLHDIVLRGEFSDFRKMLIGLGAVPYVDRIEEISCLQGNSAMEFKMKVWIALK
ncbi:MAG TPA: hypothetical protein VMU29_01640 [Smithella sp.]|nr:hypothetical protein [Smithella sp.]